jgi:hypothetical protein
VEIAPPVLAPAATHVLKDGPDGRVFAALRDRTRELRALPATRQRLLGVVSPEERTTTGLPLLEVVELTAADWAGPADASAASAHGNWIGPGSSLYPSLAEEPLPGSWFAHSLHDSDGDGVPDAFDAFPNDPGESLDTDGDGIGNNADTDDDGDTIPDVYELLYGLNPFADDAELDLDFDRLSNRGEYIAGTAANDPGSVLALKPPLFDRQKGIQLEWPAVAGRIYELYSGNLVDGSFRPVTAPIVADEDTITLDLPLDQETPHGFFRVQVRQP